MAYNAKVLLDSVNECGDRLFTVEATFPRIILAEFNTHRMLSRNAASSRAIPVSKMIEAVEHDPFIPIYWGKNQSGMQANEELDEIGKRRAEQTWLGLRDLAIIGVKAMIEDQGLHKQIANRPLEPWMWTTVIASATEWQNFFKLRCHPDAQPEMQKIAFMIRDLYEEHEPCEVVDNSWHLPLVSHNDEEELIAEGFSIEDRIKISVGRCARVSYLTHDGKRDPHADIELCNRLSKSGHWSPFEHVAQAMTANQRYSSEESMSGNFVGWTQYRKSFWNESGRA